ncbi:MAG TPA: alpha/beta fold hydrolase [Acidobacteriota bacterium]|nr:alpha/beta fold hydrolase [Acidobacteriota bacterium]
MRSKTTKTVGIGWLTVLTFVVGLTSLAVFGTPAQHAAVNKPYPVLLIHGLSSNPESWKNLPQYLENRGFTTYVMDFNEWDWLDYAKTKKKDFDEIAAVIARQIAQIKEETGRDKVNIIAHSIAGIGVRAYMADWGKRIEPRGRFSNDISRVIYLSTPHYGVNVNGNKLRLLLKETDYGEFLSNPSAIINALETGSEELIELHDWSSANGHKTGVEEITVASSGDHVVKSYCANLDGVAVNPLAPTVQNPSRHINLKQFDHAYSDWLGRSNRTIIGVGNPSHAVLGIANKFFNGEDGWKKYQTEIKKENTIVMMRIKGGGVNPKGLNLGNVKLKKVMSKKRAKRVKMDRNPDSQVFFTVGLKSGTFELELPFKGQRQTFKFIMGVAGGSGTVVNFDPSNPPPEPEPDKPDPGEKPEAPADVKDYDTLRQFVEFRFPKKAVEWLSGYEMAGLVRNVRDTLAGSYSNIGRNFAEAESRVDVFELISNDKYIDFVSGADSDGILLNKLQWNEVTFTDPDTGGGGGGTGGGDTGPLALLTIADYRAAFDAWDYSGKNLYYTSLSTTCGKFRDFLAAKYTNAERVNDQYARHRYSTKDWYKHADAVVIIREQINPSFDVIVDFCYGSSESGYLRSKLQCIWHDGPYSWWVDNAFLL